MLFTAHSTIRKPILPFLSLIDLITFASLNRRIYHETTHDIILRKKQAALEVFYALYNPVHHGIIMKNYYYEHVIGHTRRAFHLIPELFAIMEEKQCTTLKLSMICEYSGTPKHIYDYYNGNISALYQQILDGLRTTTSLIKCNIGLFRSVMNRHDLEEIILAHPSLQFISLHSGERVHVTYPPLVLSRTETGCNWGHSVNAN